MLISVDFWKSMHGFAMDYRTRDLTYKTARVVVLYQHEMQGITYSIVPRIKNKEETG